MRGQSAEYVIVFAAVVAMSLLILAQGYGVSMNQKYGFPRFALDVAALIRGVSAGYDYELNTFRDGAVSFFYADYNDDTHTVTIQASTKGWDKQPVVDELNRAYSKAGYNTKVV
jgi:hypothetical protein